MTFGFFIPHHVWSLLLLNRAEKLKPLHGYEGFRGGSRGLAHIAFTACGDHPMELSAEHGRHHPQSNLFLQTLNHRLYGEVMDFHEQQMIINLNGEPFSP